MLASANRFSLRFHRQRLEKEGKTARFPLFSFIYTFNQDLSTPRFAFLISKKSFKTSVARHALKRLLANTLRKSLADFSPHLETIIIPSSQISSISTEDIKKALLSSLRDLK